VFLEPQYPTCGQVKHESDCYCFHHCSTVHTRTRRSTDSTKGTWQAWRVRLDRSRTLEHRRRGPWSGYSRGCNPIPSRRHPCFHGSRHASREPKQESKHNLKVKLAEKNRTHFSLTNAHWQVTCGRKMAASCQSEKLIKVMGLQPAIDLLAQHSSKVSTSAEYLNVSPCPIGDHGDYENKKSKPKLPIGGGSSVTSKK
jgi:hypothetical protein